MALALRLSRARGLLCAACIVAVGLFIVTGGCPRPDTSDPNDPNDPNSGQIDPNDATDGDIDGDGTPNASDPDVDGDGTLNGDDPDIDGDGTTNTTDPDIDGDGTTNTTDPDIDGDGTDNGSDPDPNGAPDPNYVAPPPAPTSITLTALAKTGDAVPGQVAGVTFTTFGNPVIDSEGRVAFWGLYQGTGALGTGGLYVWDGTALKKVVHDDPNSAGVVPGRTAASYFQYDPNQPDVAWGAGDRLLFSAKIQPISTTSGGTVAGLYRWRTSDSNLARVADRDQVAAAFGDVSGAAAGNPVFEGAFFLPGVSDNGIATFGMHYTYIRDPNTATGLDAFVLDKNAVFTSNGTTVTRIADDSSKKAGVVPDQSADAYFVAPVSTLTTLNPSGDVLFQGAFTSSTLSGRGVNLQRGGNAYRVIDNRTGASWPGLAIGAQVSPRTPALGYALAISARQIALAGKLIVNGTSNTTALLWDGDAGNWTVLYGPGSTPASALLTGVNDDGQVVILAGGSPYLTSRTSQTRLDTTLPAQLQGATVVWADSGGSINNHGRVVLAYTNSTKPGLALWTGERLLIIADTQLGTPANSADLRTITGTERNRPGRSGLLNDADQLAFRTVLADSTEAIYLAEGE